MGYHRAGFEVVGVDIKPQPHYPFEFHQADALAWEDFDGFEAVHASPPCQAYTTMNNRHGSKSPPLIAATRAALLRAGRPYVIENVPGARLELRNPSRLCGRACGLRLHRHRLFETSFPMLTAGCSRPDSDDVAIYGKLDGRRLWTRRDGSELRAVGTLAEAADAMGIDWMEWDELREAIPPAFTELVGAQLAPARLATEGRAMPSMGRRRRGQETNAGR
jgi:DNA (cytosine-5)-methyltransferase 1